MAQRGIQLIFYFANFLFLGGSFKAINIPLWVIWALKTLIRPKIKLESLGFEPLTVVDSILLSKLALFIYHFHIEAVVGRGQALYLGILWNLLF